jgi:tRNA(fMet)-specific endonuclease VapC
VPGRKYLLDTNVLSDLIKHPGGPVAQRIASYGEDSVCTSIVVACELRYGAAKKGSPTLSLRVEPNSQWNHPNGSMSR